MIATAIFQYTPHGWQFLRSYWAEVDKLEWPECATIGHYGDRLSIQGEFRSLPERHGFCKPPHVYLFGG